MQARYQSAPHPETVVSIPERCWTDKPSLIANLQSFHSPGIDGTARLFIELVDSFNERRVTRIRLAPLPLIGNSVAQINEILPFHACKYVVAFLPSLRLRGRGVGGKGH